MPLPVQISFHGLDHSDALAGWIREWADKLERVSDRIDRCDVVVTAPHRRHRQGTQYRVRVHLHVPGTDIVVDRDPGPDEAHADPYVAVRDSFHAARRRLEDHVRRLRGDVKTHAPGEHARIVYLDVEGEWGWLETADGRRIYFHRNSVLGGARDELRLGTAVRFVEEPGEQGPQATTVELIGELGPLALPPT